MKKKTIIYFKQIWDTNIGNEFIDIGALISLNEAMNGKEHILIETGTLNSEIDSIKKIQRFGPIVRPFWRAFGKYLGRDFLDKRHNMIKSNDRFNLSETIKADYAIFSGCILTVMYFSTKERLFEKLKENGVKIIFYGVGGNTYSDFEVNYIREKLKSIKPYAILTRDSVSFKHYSDLAEYAFDGLEPAFYLNKLSYLKDIKLDITPYVVLAFDKPENRDIKKNLEEKFGTDYNVINLSHIPFPNKAYFIDTPPPRTRFISNSSYDYILLYSQAKEVHSDRVHACVPTLAFGNPCRLYNKTLRANLFEKVCTGNIIKEICRPNNITSLQKKQVDILSQILEG